MADDFYNGQPWREQYLLNLSQSSEIGAWTTGTDFPFKVGSPHVIVTNNRVYAIAGVDNGVNAKAVYTAPIDAVGTVGSWTTGVSLPENLVSAKVIITLNRVYLIGGLIDNNFTSKIYTAPINVNGTLGTWTASGTGTVPIFYACTEFVTKNRVYLVGETFVAEGDGLPSTYSAPINIDGTLGSWVSGPTLPAATGIYWNATIGNTVYVVSQADIYKATFDSSGILGSWVSAGTLPLSINEAACVVTHGRIFLIGGATDHALDTVYSAPISSEVIGSWSVSSNTLPVALTSPSVFVTSTKVYLIGFMVDFNFSKATAFASFNGGYDNYLDKSYGIPSSVLSVVFNSSGGGVAGGAAEILASALITAVVFNSSGGGVAGGASVFSSEHYVGGTIFSTKPECTGYAETSVVVIGTVAPKGNSIRIIATTSILANAHISPSSSTQIGQALTTNLSKGSCITKNSILVGYTGDTGNAKFFIPIISCLAITASSSAGFINVPSIKLQSHCLENLMCYGTFIGPAKIIKGISINASMTSCNILATRTKLFISAKTTFDSEYSVIKYRQPGKTYNI